MGNAARVIVLALAMSGAALSAVWFQGEGPTDEAPGSDPAATRPPGTATDTGTPKDGDEGSDGPGNGSPSEDGPDGSGDPGDDAPTGTGDEDTLFQPEEVDEGGGPDNGSLDEDRRRDDNNDGNGTEEDGTDEGDEDSGGNESDVLPIDIPGRDVLGVLPTILLTSGMEGVSPIIPTIGSNSSPAENGTAAMDGSLLSVPQLPAPGDSSDGGLSLAQGVPFSAVALVAGALFASRRAR